MKRRNWIVPALLALPFVVPVVYDIYRAVSAGEAQPVNLLAAGGEGPIFVSSDLVLDLRLKPTENKSVQNVIPKLLIDFSLPSRRLPRVFNDCRSIMKSA